MSQTKKKTLRLDSLDIFRGITVACMVLVNSPGNLTPYPLLSHSDWNGCTLADLVFPFFIFILGISAVLGLNSQRGQSNTALFAKILKRSITLFLIGLFLNAFPHHFEFSTLRVFGVLQRIAICYFITSLLFLTTRTSTQAILTMSLLIIYWLIMTQLPATGHWDLTPEGNFAAYVDRAIFSAPHLYGKVFDPEGLLSTIPAIATALMGNLTGIWLVSSYNKHQKVLGLMAAGVLAVITGWCWGLWFPINKSLWTSSYVLWTAGLALLSYATCYWVVEIKGWEKGLKSFVLFGRNAIFVFILHVLFLKIQSLILIKQPDGSTINARLYITKYWFGGVSEPNAALLYACSYTLLWLLIIKLRMIAKQRNI